MAAYRVHFDGSGLKLLTAANSNHEVVASQDGRELLDIASTPTSPQVATVIDRDGKILVEVPRQDISRLQSMGWQPLSPSP